jgi:hypothetical protein
VVVDDILNDGDSVAVAFTYEVLVLVAAAGAGFDDKVVGVAIPPGEGSAEFGHRQQLDGVDTEGDQMRDEVHGVLQVPREVQAIPIMRGVSYDEDRAP